MNVVAMLEKHKELVRETSKSNLYQGLLTTQIIVATHPFPTSSALVETLSSLGYKHRPTDVFIATCEYYAIKYALYHVQNKAYVKLACEILDLDKSDLQPSLEKTLSHLNSIRRNVMAYNAGMRLLSGVVSMDRSCPEELKNQFHEQHKKLQSEKEKANKYLDSSASYKVIEAQGLMNPIIEDFLYRTAESEADTSRLKELVSYRELPRLPRESYPVTLDMASLIYMHIIVNFEEDNKAILLHRFKSLNVLNSISPYIAHSDGSQRVLKIYKDLDDSHRSGLFLPEEFNHYTMLINKLTNPVVRSGKCER